MASAFKENDAVLVNRLSYFLRKPKVGDVVVLKRKNYIIKRIAKINPSTGSGNKYFVLGDNLKESIDSREFGWVTKKEIIGKVIWKNN